MGENVLIIGVLQDVYSGCFHTVTVISLTLYTTWYSVSIMISCNDLVQMNGGGEVVNKPKGTCMLII